MKKISLIIIILAFTAVSVKTQNFLIDQFKLTGRHIFEKKGAKKWVVWQELIDEKRGESVFNKNFAEAKGTEAKFDLTKIKDKETIYHISAQGERFTQKYKIRVFESDKISSFLYKSGNNPDLRTYIFVPKTVDSNTRILLVMHGLSRNADEYIASWEIWAAENNYIVIAPYFDEENWKGSAMYNLGNIFTDDGVRKNRSEWSFQIVEDIYKMVKKGFGLKRNYFDIFGHSAGGQFVHRFALFMPDSDLRLAIAANSGWYTLPDLEQKFPYGLKHPRLSFTRGDMLKWSRRHVFIMRGTDDTERTENLRQTPEADAQGQNRSDRAGFMFEKIKSVNPETNWRLLDVPNVAHSQKAMAGDVQKVLEQFNSRASAH